MRFEWKDADSKDLNHAERWLDDETRRMTGLDEGWTDYYDYCINDELNRLGDNFWCKVVAEATVPVAMIALTLTDEGYLYVCEYTVDPDKRNKGIGTAILNELFQNPELILGKSIVKSRAVIFPNNEPSKHTFEKAGFKFESSHPDGDAWYYVKE